MSAYLYTDFSRFLSKYFSGKVQKLTVNAGFTCPNRDGKVGWGGCTYCNNQSFHPHFSRQPESVTAQLEAGKRFFARKYPEMGYLAYFQAYTNTYGQLDGLMALYEEALGVERVRGLVIGTRPDCVDRELLERLAQLQERCFVLLEYGVESTQDKTLRRINRGHDFAAAERAIRATAACGLPVGVHLILGLPGESETEMLQHAAVLSELPIDTLKLHQLQIVRGTKMAREYAERPEDFRLYSAEEYARLVADFLEQLCPEIAVERFTSQTPRDLLLAPDWGLKNYEFVEKVKRELVQRGSCQGAKWHKETSAHPEKPKHSQAI